MSDPLPPKRSMAWLRPLGVAGIGLAAVVGGVWLVRAPLTNWALDQALADRGVAGEWRIDRLDATGATLSSVQIGAPEAPDFTAENVQLAWRWRGLSPTLSEITLTRPVLTGAIDQTGVKFGALDKLAAGPATRRTELPAAQVKISGGLLKLATPAGAVTGRIDANGRLGEDFAGDLAITAPGASANSPAAIQARLTVPATGPALTFKGRLETLTWEGIKLSGVGFEGAASAPLGLERAEMRLTAAAGAITLGKTEIGYAGGAANFQITDLGPGLRPRAWTGDGEIKAQTVNAEAVAAADAALHWSAAGDAATGAGSWRLDADRGASGPLAAAFAGAGKFRLTEALTLDADGAVAITPPRQGQAPSAPLPALAGTPLEPLIAAAQPRLQRALRTYQGQAPIKLTWRKDRGRLDIVGPVSANSPEGMQFDAHPAGADTSLLRVDFPSGAISGAGALTLTGAGLPDLAVALAPFRLDAQKRELTAQIKLSDWRAGGAFLRMGESTFSLDGAGPDAAFRFTGAVEMSGPLAGGAVQRLRGPIDLVGTLGATFRVGPAVRSLPLRYDRLQIADLNFGPGAVQIGTDASGAYVRREKNGRLSGGFDLGRTEFAGAATSGAPVRIGLDGARASLANAAGGGVRMTGQLSGLRYSQTIAADRTLAVRAANAPFVMIADDKGWRVDGTAADGVVEDPALPAHVDDLSFAWRMAPHKDGVQFDLSDGAGQVTDKDAKPRFNPLRLTAVKATLVDGAVLSDGGLALASNGAALGKFTGRHDLQSGAGSAQVTVRALTFAPELELFQLTELARGVVENVRGPVDGDFEARWTLDSFKVDGALALNAISAATAGLGPIDGVSGKIAFDDLALLSTPPGQTILVGSINPGIEVRDGVVKFQLLPNGIVALQAAEFPFAKGTLAVAPTQVTIGAPESRYTLTLRDVDISAFVEQMQFKDLTATGTVQGEFPLVITPNRAEIQNGRVVAGPAGGLIRYDGAAGEAKHAGDIAFQALRGFRYDQLELEFNGPLDGEVVANVRFRGVNVAPVEVAPGIGRIAKADGLPFRFNVKISAPFRTLAESGRRAANPLELLRSAQPLPPPPQ